jgi:hypothetical protein
MRVSMSRPVAAALAGALVLLASPTASATLPQAQDQAHHRRHVITVKVDPRLFGVHDAHLTSLNRTSTGSIRLWDTGTKWSDLEPTEGHWSWGRLDTIVKRAHANGTEVTLVLGLSPSYAAPRPTDAPNVTKYQTYLRTVMERYSPAHWGYRGIAAYQVWNEANIETFWTGTVSQIAQLTKAAYDVRNQVDRGALIVAPAMVTRLKYEQKGISRFYRATVPSTGRPVWKYVDAISLNLYPTDQVTTSSGRTRAATPEDAITLLNTVRGRLARADVPASIPIWDTEINYGMRTGTMAGKPATKISSGRQTAYLMRTFLLNAAQGLKRVDWYAYDMGELTNGGTLGNTLLTDPRNQSAGTRTPAGLAFTRIRAWMRGTLVGTATHRPCLTDRRGTYTCKIRYAHGVGRVYWNPYRTAKVRLVRSAHRLVNEYGARSRVDGGQKLRVTYRPVLVKSRR